MSKGKKSSNTPLLIGTGVFLVVLIVVGILFGDRIFNIQKDDMETTDTVVTEESEFDTWQSRGVPEIFIEYTDGDIAKQELAGPWAGLGEGNFIQIYNTSVEEIENYVDLAKRMGWDIKWENEVMAEEDASWAISLQEDNITHSVILNWYEEDIQGEQYLMLILTSADYTAR